MLWPVLLTGNSNSSVVATPNGLWMHQPFRGTKNPPLLGMCFQPEKRKVFISQATTLGHKGRQMKKLNVGPAVISPCVRLFVQLLLDEPTKVNTEHAAIIFRSEQGIGLSRASSQGK